jgi:hypothetical protein
MSFSAENIAAFETKVKAGLGVMLKPQQVDLYQGATVQIKLAVGTRRASSSEVTSGAEAETLIATVDADDWDAKAGRPPQQGDIIWWLGTRHAVERPHVAAPGGNKIFYKLRLKG